MGADLEQDKNGIWVVSISGVFSKRDMDTLAEMGVKTAQPQGEAKLLIKVAKNFSGWTKDDNWNDMSFFLEHGDKKISKIAIVGDPKWEQQMLAFYLAGIRHAPVKYFDSKDTSAAYRWLTLS